MYLADVFTTTANLAGLPAVSFPAGFDPAGLPIGVQLVGRHFEEGTILRLAHAFQQATDHHRRRPRMAGSSISITRPDLL
jgi:aspartyl-tRNA(Asn)/glutamyl-tRNA(Gln) amidotransferase subunit A